MVMAVLHDGDHYAVLEIDICNKKVIVYNYLYRDLDRWLDHVFSAMKHCVLCDLEAANQCESDTPRMENLDRSRHGRMSIKGYKLMAGNTDWRFQRGHFIKQVDGFNCRPIACAKILEMFHLTTTFDIKMAYETNSIRNLVVEHWNCFVNHCDKHLTLRVRERRNRDTTEPTIDPVIAAAAAASDEAEVDHLQLCFCYCDSSNMELVMVQCCQQTYHCQCLLAHLGSNSQCAYCRSAAITIAGVLELPTNDRSELLAPIMLPPKQTSIGKRDLQWLNIDNTPLRASDQVREDSMEKTRPTTGARKEDDACAGQRHCEQRRSSWCSRNCEV